MIVFQLIFNILASNNCFSHRNVFQKDVNTFSKMWFFFFFFQKVQNFIEFGLYDFVQISPARGPNTYQIMYVETLDMQCLHQQW